MAAGEIEQRAAQIEARRQQRQNQLPLPHPVHRHVDVVAAARRVQPPGDVLSARGDDQALDVEKQILAAAVERRAADLVLRHAVERHAERVRVSGGDDVRRGEHHQVGVVDLHQRREEERLRVLEVLVEHVLDVLGSESRHFLHHVWSMKYGIARTAIAAARSRSAGTANH